MTRTEKGTAALPVVEARVKPLEWKSTDGDLQRAETPFGYSYFANPRSNMWIGQSDDWAVSDDPKAAAQADYERRVLSALLPAPSALPEGEGIQRFDWRKPVDGLGRMPVVCPDGEWVRYEEYARALAAATTRAEKAELERDAIVAKWREIYPNLDAALDVAKASEARAASEYQRGLEDAAKVAAQWLSAGFATLHAGEMSAQEIRTVKAIVRAIISGITALQPQPSDAPAPKGDA